MYNAQGIGTRIRALRKKSGESQAQLGDSIGLSQNAISKIESEKTDLKIEHLFSIAAHYNVSHEYICTGKEGSSILTLLEKYVSLQYKTIVQGDETLICPTLLINKSFFDYLIETAKINRQKLSDNVRNTWISEVINAFYMKNQPDSSEKPAEVVPLPENLIYPDDNKENWRQRDLLHEMNRQFLEL